MPISIKEVPFSTVTYIRLGRVIVLKDADSKSPNDVVGSTSLDITDVPSSAMRVGKELYQKDRISLFSATVRSVSVPLISAVMRGAIGRGLALSASLNSMTKFFGRLTLYATSNSSKFAAGA